MPEGGWSWLEGSCREGLTNSGGLSLFHFWVRGEWWRMVSAGLLHGSLMHALVNLWSLWVVGPWLERIAEAEEAVNAARERVRERGVYLRSFYVVCGVFY